MRHRRHPPPPKLSGMKPESLMMSHGYVPEWSEGSIKPPIFQTSTFAFRTAEEGKEFFEYAYGLKERDPKRPMGLIYSRLNNPDLEILEERLNLWDEAEAGAVFSSGMSAISTSLLALVGVGESVVFLPPDLWRVRSVVGDDSSRAWHRHARVQGRGGGRGGGEDLPPARRRPAPLPR